MHEVCRHLALSMFPQGMQIHIVIFSKHIYHCHPALLIDREEGTYFLGWGPDCDIGVGACENLLVLVRQRVKVHH
jgi:hypothetical protein